MIQRLQSLYLLFAALFVTLFLVFGEVWYTVVAAFYPWVTPVALALGGLTALVALVAVFLYKNRQAQRKAILAAQWLDLAFVLVLVGAIVGILLSDDVALGPASTSVYLTLLMPIVAYVFLRLARRGVEKDIALVRSMDRLR
jgi:divalent metal cation (Fe/Co/Zn/Cd) transporter